MYIEIALYTNMDSCIHRIELHEQAILSTAFPISSERFCSKSAAIVSELPHEMFHIMNALLLAAENKRIFIKRNTILIALQVINSPLLSRKPKQARCPPVSFSSIAQKLTITKSNF